MPCLVAQSCLALWNPVDCSPPGSSVHGDSPGKNIGLGCHVLLQGIFPTQGLSPGLLHCRPILYCPNHQGSPINTGVGSLSLIEQIFPTQESNWGLLHCRWILYQLSYQGRILEWVAISLSRGSSQPRDWEGIVSPSLAGVFFTR